MPKHLIPSDLNTYYTKTEVDEIAFPDGSGVSPSMVRNEIAKEWGYNFTWFIPDVVMNHAANVLGHPIGGGTSHPLNLFYTSLSDAQAAFPNATDLTQETESLGLQLAIDYIKYNTAAVTKTLIIPKGTYPIKNVEVGYGYSIAGSPAYSTIHIYGANPAGNQGQGTTFICDDPNGYCMNIQGNAHSSISNITIIGPNGGIGGGVLRSDYITSYTTIKDTQYSPCTGVGVDLRHNGPHSGDTYADVNYYLQSDIQYWKSVSTDIKFYNLNVSQFPDCFGIQSNGSITGNADFISWHNCIMDSGVNGISQGCNQGRNSKCYSCNFSNIYNAVGLDQRGSLQGRFEGFENCHFSCYNMISFSYAVWAGHISVDDCHFEDHVRIGHCGNDDFPITLIFNNCNMGLTGQDKFNHTPATVADGSTQIIFNGGSITGRALGFKMTKPPIFNNTTIGIYPGFSMDARFHLLDNLSVYKQAFRNHPVCTFDAQSAKINGGHIIGETFTWDCSRPMEGSNWYPQKNLQGFFNSSEQRGIGSGNSLQPGQTGIANDYMWTYNSYVNGLGGSFSAGRWNFPKANLPVAIRNVVKSSDYFVAGLKGLWFMVSSVDSTTVYAEMMAGYTVNNVNAVVGYDPAINTADVTDTDTNWYWYNNNHYMTSPTKGTVSGSTISTVAYEFGAMGRNANPVNELRVGVVYLYNYTDDFFRETSKWSINYIDALDATAGTVTLRNSCDLSGKVAIRTGPTTLTI